MIAGVWEVMFNSHIQLLISLNLYMRHVGSTVTLRELLLPAYLVETYNIIKGANLICQQSQQQNELRLISFLWRFRIVTFSQGIPIALPMVFHCPYALRMNTANLPSSFLNPSTK